MTVMSGVKTALVTGAARRIGAAIACALHCAGYDIILHYHTSQSAATTLANKLNQARANSVHLIKADLTVQNQVNDMVDSIITSHPSLALLVNNAALFYPTKLQEAQEKDWDCLINCNLKAPFFLAKGLREC